MTTPADVAAWLDEEWNRLAPRLSRTTGHEHVALSSRMATIAELCGAFRGWQSSGNPPQHCPDWRNTDGRRP